MTWMTELRGPSTKVLTRFVSLISSQHSLAVVRVKSLRWLGLRSLKEVSAGRVMLKDNSQLCYTGPARWHRLFKSDDQVITVRNNAAPEDCGGCPDVFRLIYLQSDVKE